MRKLIMAGAILLAAGVAGTAGPGFAAAAEPMPIVFVHGDSDTAGRWIVQVWRFESNGYPRDRIYAVDLDHPGSGNDDTKPEENRSTTVDVAAQLAGAVARAKLETGADKVVLIGNSRGCNTIRNYVRNGGGAANAGLLILTGCLNHGVFSFPGVSMGSEWNGAGNFLSGLNAGSEVTPGIETVTIRSDKFDLYAQPTGEAIGMAGKPTGIDHDTAVLRGATNLVIEGADHRETGYSAKAFAIMYKTITGRAPMTNDVVAEEQIVLNGEVSGWVNDRPTNQPVAGAHVMVFETNPDTGERVGEAVHDRTVGDDGRWGPFEAKADTTYEFVIEAGDYGTHHIYRSPFPRSSEILNLRLVSAPKGAEGAVAAVNMMRPRGYFGRQRDQIALGGEMPADIPDTAVPMVWKTTRTLDSAEPATVVGSYNGETIAARSWPAADGHTVWIQLTY
ncbi:alpha/beta fold hydrolase [Oceanibacterium hippocampi]|uniref:Lipase (Class 2) n=1 Tax=Oceanibacterium hippocampi TaxID=745714 RepID=A0A1Y5TVV2_9PROT|nr:alpha/beta fold hydrolase [Oceanibacterium hippocampi]SLN69368.1 Lipase (class 2) [Oceanibacterium hippocampi]